MAGPLRVPESIERDHPGADHRATECVLNLLRTAGIVEHRLARLFREHGLSLATFNALMVLAGSRRPLCPWEIGERLLVTRGTVTGLLDSLEKRGLVRRAAHPDDRRMLIIQITDEARRLLDRVLPRLFPAEAAMLAGLTAREKEMLVRLLGKVQAGLEDDGAGALPA